MTWMLERALKKSSNCPDSRFYHTPFSAPRKSAADKFGLTNDKGFWKEIKKIRREYMKAVGSDTSRYISSYEHSSRSIDEFMAEAFTHAKMRELGLSLPAKYGGDSIYSQKVLDAVNKYFGKSNISGRENAIIH